MKNIKCIPTAVKLSKKDFLKEITSNIEKVPFKFVVEQKKKNDAELHTNMNDLFFLISGQLQFNCNGKLINPQKSIKDQNTLISSLIKNGKKIILKPNDWLFVPANCPHQRITLKKSRFLVIKFPVNS